ncbi:MAG: response regulator transcription factor [Rhodococcus sp. (in: high G+C Gram-positive bacteria)]|nr:MAG: response regulator transcription factor [Rhodococcus sp. (in: high G+C Gram-positive bacteria)]
MILALLVELVRVIHAGIPVGGWLSLVVTAAGGYAAMNALASTDVDVVLMDIRMPGIDGVEATRRMCASHAPEDLRILVLTTFDQDENVLAALRAGADGFFSKGAGPAELTDGILRVALGERALSSSAVDAVVDHVTERRNPPEDPAVEKLFASLTPREREVVEAIVTGLNNAQIAARMFLSPFTVKTHANRAMMKVGARDRAQLVSLAVQAGIHP